jgi:hypothetical protein
MLHTRDLSGIIQVDADSFHWSLLRENQWCTADGFQGPLISVKLNEMNGRELLLQLNHSSSRRLVARAYRNRKQIQRGELEQGIRLALLAGWEPTKRGKPFRFEPED